jgi:hypothetical protein
MKDYRVLFGYAAILLSIGFVIRSITFAYAYPTGPNVSMGSNPIENFYGFDGISGQSNNTIFTSTSLFIITQFLSNNNDWCGLQIDGQSVFNHYNNSLGLERTNSYSSFKGTIVVSAGSTVSIKNLHPSSQMNCAYYLEGYYTHP